MGAAHPLVGRTMSSYDEVEIEDMQWRDDLGAFTYPCPCGDLFLITRVRLRPLRLLVVCCRARKRGAPVEGHKRPRRREHRRSAAGAAIP